MRINRREIMTGSSAALLLPIVQGAAAQNIGKLPNPANFQSGDLIWPKKSGVYIPYKYMSKRGPEEDLRQWNNEKADFLRRAAASNSATDKAAAENVANMSFNEFRDKYLRGRDMVPLGGSGSGDLAAVGHVGIVEIDAQKRAWVIEAMPETGVARMSYQAWLSNRAGEIVWHGRLANMEAARRATIVDAAKSYLGKPYVFWNYDLADDSGFYCSKLVWLAIRKATDVAVDGNPEPKRKFWLSPKQILYAALIQRLFDPGLYAIE